MKKKIIIGVVIGFILIIIIDLIVFKPWLKEASIISEVEAQSVTIEESLDVSVIPKDSNEQNIKDEDQEQLNENIEETDIFVEDEELYEFLNDLNDYRTIYEEGHFSKEVFELQDDELPPKDVTKVYDIMNRLYEVVHNGVDEATLKGYVEGISYDKPLRYKLNSFMQSLSIMPEYMIQNSFRISENVYYINIFMTEPIGDVIEGATLQDTIFPVTYNIETGILSCQQTLFRQPVNLMIEDENFKAYCYMSEGTTEGTYLYLSLSHKSSTDVLGSNFPIINAVSFDENGTKTLLPVSVPIVDVLPYFPGESYYFLGTTMYMIDTISGIEFNYWEE